MNELSLNYKDVSDFVAINSNNVTNMLTRGFCTTINKTYTKCRRNDMKNILSTNVGDSGRNEEAAHTCVE